MQRVLRATTHHRVPQEQPNSAASEAFLALLPQIPPMPAYMIEGLSAQFGERAAQLGFSDDELIEVLGL